MNVSDRYKVTWTREDGSTGERVFRNKIRMVKMVMCLTSPDSNVTNVKWSDKLGFYLTFDIPANITSTKEWKGENEL